MCRVRIFTMIIIDFLLIKNHELFLLIYLIGLAPFCLVCVRVTIPTVTACLNIRELFDDYLQPISVVFR